MQVRRGVQEGAEEDEKAGEYHSYSECPSLGLKPTLSETFCLFTELLILSTAHTGPSGSV